MDTVKISELLRATIEPTQRMQAEEQLNQVHKIIGFLPSLLQVVMQNEVEMPVRLAGAIYLKNLVNSSWPDKEAEAGNPIPFAIHEQDRAMVRDTIVEAIVHVPAEVVRAQLCFCLSHIIKSDFPGRWTQVVDKVSLCLQSSDPNAWHGALLCMYQLVKHYEYKKSSERFPLTEAMNLLLPQIYTIMLNVLNEPSEQSVLMQKQILKIYYALTQYWLPLEVISKDVFASWMEICRQILERPAPDSSHIEEEERPQLPWWKTKKWASHIILRMFERYGSPGNVISKEYKEFADWFLQTFTSGLLTVLLKILDQYRNKVYVSPRVMTNTLDYIKTAVSHAYSWKMLKPHIIEIIRDVIFPLMSYTDADEELWDSDPIEYIRKKFDVFDDFVSPVQSAEMLLHNCCKTRKGILTQVMQIIMQIINTPNLGHKEKDGALHMVGSLAEVLLRKKIFKEQVEQLLMQYVFPEFASPHGHMRARACWVMHYFSDIKLKSPQVLEQVMRFLSNALLTDKELPVKVEAAVSMQMYLIAQDDAAPYLEGQIKEITMELLKIIRETENEELTTVLQKIVCTYSDQLPPIAVDICQHLATTFSQVLETDENGDEKAITAMGLLSTMETLLAVMDEHPQVLASLHPIVLQIIGHVLQQNVFEFYEEAFGLVCDLTSKSISPDMWKLLELIYQLFEKNGADYFVDMMPALHNYITVDTPAFLSNQNHVIAMYNMCKSILASSASEESECSAAKLLEVIILQCKGHIDDFIPSFVELALMRLTREVKTSELRTMCLQVVIAAIYYNPTLLLDILEKIPIPVPDSSITAHFIRQWLHDYDCFLGIHDRKLCIIGLCTLLSMGERKPTVLSELPDKIIPTMLLIFDGLKRAYAARAAEGEEEESEDESEDLEDGLSSDEDDVDEMSPYFKNVTKMVQDKASEAGFEVTASIQDADSDDDDEDDDDDDDDGDEIDETALESYTTPLDDEENPNAVDEYILFQDVMNNLPNTDPTWYTMLTRNLNASERKNLQDVLVLANQKKETKRSKEIEKSGGFQFTQHQVPSTFSFTGQQ
ncbi:importin-7 [Anopheles ziemanni]|uniref:importin-7 n=1 Tax=Anopheles coustani TaxID=139045 RepID=UPI00265B6C1F|nr:importin-7 [Anopheles coustani]XP_058168306.1 importin-7 [Anopheles ziemanni]